MIILKIMACLFLGLIVIGFIGVVGILLAWLKQLIVAEKEDEEEEIDHE